METKTGKVLTLQKKNCILFFFLILLTLFSFALSDNPVHCSRDEIAGKWNFFINKEIFAPSFLDIKTTCGHGFPHLVEKDIGDQPFSFADFYEYKFELAGNHDLIENEVKIGRWTPVYDEGFIVYSNKGIFTAFSKFYLEDKNSDTYTSNCDKTMIGWFKPENNSKEWSCFYGVKEGKDNFLKKEEKKSNISFMQVIVKHQRSFETTLYDEHQDLVNKINSSNLSWKAEIFHEFKGKSLFEVSNRVVISLNS